MKTRWIITTLLLMAISGGVAWSQTEVVPGPGYSYPAWRFPYGGYDGYGGTYEGSVLMGWGAFARGVGEYNYYSALAVRELEEARAQAIRNHEAAVASWLTLRHGYQERRKAKWEEERLTPTELVQLIEAKRPVRLTAAQYQPASGKLSWPAILMGEEFAQEREAIEKMFAARTTKDTGAESMFYGEVNRMTEQMLGKLREKLPESNTMAYIAGKKFLVSLKYESVSPVNAAALAMSD